MGQQVTALVSVHSRFCLSDPNGFLYVSGSYVWLFNNDAL